MLDGTYEVLAAGHRGTAWIESVDDALSVTVKIPGFPRQRGVGTCMGDVFAASGTLKIPLFGALEYEIEGTVNGDLLEAICATNRGTFSISGVRRA